MLRVAGETLLRRTARLALEAGCAPVLAVLGHAAGQMRPEEANDDGYRYRYIIMPMRI